MGLKVGIVTAAADDLDLTALADLKVVRKSSAESTAFRNEYTPEGRTQWVTAIAARLGPDDIPASWRATSIVHLAPLALELEPELCHHFEGSFLGLTPQGLMREWDSAGLVSQTRWETRLDWLPYADAVVVSDFDLGMNREFEVELASQCSLLAVTCGSLGVRVYAEGATRSFPAPEQQELDPTGAGDIFAAVFFARLHKSGDPWSAAEFANRLAAPSVAHSGLQGAPIPDEVRAARQPEDV